MMSVLTLGLIKKTVIWTLCPSLTKPQKQDQRSVSPTIPSQVSTVTYTASQCTKHVRGAAHQELLSRTKALHASEHNEKS